ncbi:steroid hormone receptor ERR2-like [Dreissena polymorpha]|uniref:steroid hormone receptor ERR2-like n=1 Tax=Dreissena polymorpha TaxID=45954 RepID=UPI0022643AA2|nr:steroid hormone receptor ERR2-like [Dreissena polymorpha]
MSHSFEYTYLKYTILFSGNIDYSCPANGDCEITKRRRKACQACRFQKCLFVGMLREGVRLDRVRGGRQKYKRSSDSYPYVQQIFPIVKKQCLDTSINNHSYSVSDNKTLQQLISIEHQLDKLYAHADPTVKDDECKFLSVLSDLADRELVITISWAKQVPGFAGLSLSDQMNLLQHSWLEINLLNLVYRSSPYHGVLRIAEDYKLTAEQAEKFGCSKELDTLTRKMCKKFTSLNITREEYLLLKSIILFNIDVVTERSDAGKSIQEKLHESLTEYVKSRSNGGLKRVGQLYLLLPAMTHLKLLAKQYWFDVKKSGKIMMHKLFLEMLEADS